MRHLNYGHLLYFWTVAREGSVTQAAKVLHLTAQTISGQIRTLEGSIGEELFLRDGRKLVLSAMGKVVFEYADEIFSIGTELAEVVRGHSVAIPRSFTVGVTDVLPKLVAARMLEPVYSLGEPVKIICLEGKLEALLGDLAIQRLDIVLSDRPAPGGMNIRVFNHLLGRSTVSFFGSNKVARRLRNKFPRSLSGEAALLPTANTAMRRAMDQWFEHHDIAPQIIGEFEDSALLKAFGCQGWGVFAGPTVLCDAIKRQYGVAVVGEAKDLHEEFYAISPERRIKHPAVAAITEYAKTDVFAQA